MKRLYILMSIILGLFISLIPSVVVYADSTDSLPKGFVAPEDMFGYNEEYKTEITTVNELLNFALIDGVYLVFDYVEDNDGCIYGKKQEPDSEYDEISQTMTNTPSPFAITLDKKHSGSITASGTFYKKHTFPPGGMMAGTIREIKNEMTITISNVTFKQNPKVTHDSYDIYADVKGRLIAAEGNNGLGEPDVFDLITVDDGKCYSSYYEDDNGKTIFYASFRTRTEEINLSYVTIYFRFAGVLPKGVKSADVTSNALMTNGEDGGVSVPAAIVIGIVAAGTALGGVAIASGGGEGSAALDEEKRRKSYKMYVQKDFGDAIRKGAKQPSIVRARMAEIDELGKEKDRDDLTKKINASSSDMEVVNTRVNGRYLEASVRIPESYENDRATLTFAFVGEGGTFTNNIIFRVVDGPELQFILVGEGEGTYNENCGINAIEGDGFTYDATFEIVNATTPPKKEDISSTKNSKFDVEFEETNKPSTFKMLVKNKSVCENPDDIFTKIKEEKFEINVKLEDEEKPLTGYVRVDLYQEGITVDSKEKGEKGSTKYIQIQAYEKDKSEGLDGAWQATEIKITLAIKGDNKIIINPKEAEYELSKLTDSGGLGSSVDIERSIASKFDYKDELDKNNYKEPRYTFMPHSHLVEPEDETFYMVFLPIKATYDGHNYDCNIPLRLRGKDTDPMEKEWQKEYDKLKERIQKYSTPENKSKWEEKLYDLVKDAKPSVEELRLTSKYVVMQYMRYWTIEAEKHLDEAKMYDKIVDYLEWAKFFGDCAFSYLISVYTGPAGPVVDAIISPIKDFAIEAAVEVIARKIRGQSVEFDKFDFVKVALSIGDNLVSGNISITDWRKAASTLGMYFAYATMKNFYINLVENDKCDLYGALIAGFKDMTKAALMSMAGKLFDDVLKHYRSSRKKIRAKIGIFITENLGAGKTFDLRDAGDITRTGYLRKVLDGLFGKGLDYLLDKAKEDHDKLIDSDTDIDFNEKGELVAKVYFYAFDQQYKAGINLTKIFLYGTAGLSPVTFFMYLYNEYFGKVPSATSLIEAPNDPPLPKDI
ncbi:MAG: hypothetical protein J5666_06620 [Bacilli bacterium]|nr:hypothetical protein [Bacilli bacterium]